MHSMGLAGSHICRICQSADETPFHVVCAPLASTRFYVFGKDIIKDPKVIEEISPLKAWKFLKEVLK